MPGSHLIIDNLHLDSPQSAPLEYPFGTAEGLIAWFSGDAYPIGVLPTPWIKNEVPQGETLGRVTMQDIPIVPVANGRKAFDMSDGATGAYYSVLRGFGLEGRGDLSIDGVLPSQPSGTIVTAFATTHSTWSQMLVFNRLNISLGTSDGVVIGANNAGRGNAILGAGSRLPAHAQNIHLLAVSYQVGPNDTVVVSARLRRADGITASVREVSIGTDPSASTCYQWRANSAPGDGARIASQAVFDRALSLEEIDSTVLPPLQDYYGVA